MDVCKAQPPVAMVQRKTAEENLRPPLAPSEKNNGAPAQRKSRTREVTSRYKSGITPLTIPPPSSSAATQRCPSPNVGRTALSPSPPLPKRSQSAERRRPRTPTFRASTPWSPSRSPASCSPSSKTSTPVHDVTAGMQPSSKRSGVGRTVDGLWPSMRSLSASFLKVSLSTPLGNRDERNSNSDTSPDHALKSLIHARKDGSFQSENFKPVENTEARATEPHRWPGQMSTSFSARGTSRSMDFSDGGGRALTMPSYLRGPSPTWIAHISGEQSRGPQRTPKEVTRTMSLDGSGQLERELSAAMGTSLYHFERAPSSTRPNRTLSVPLGGSPCPSPTSKPLSPSSTSCRSMASPSRSMPSTPASSRASFARTGIQSSVISYFANLRKGKRSAAHIEDAHQLRILENRCLQWRFVNARAQVPMSVQRITSKNILFNVWDATSEMSDSVVAKRIRMEQLVREMKVSLILKAQMKYLDEWAFLEKAQSGSLVGAIEALKSSTLQLPVTGGAKADVYATKNAIRSAFDVMQAIGSSISELFSTVEGASSMASDLAATAAKERAALDDCRELLSLIAEMQVKQSSLRAHLIQLRRQVVGLEPTGPTMGALPG
ncbi:unnamed protein product [Spirodela intermedia]|uniref:Uncharacterized protein n=1 Tax=Spirodela intermedia TaxID=51605 RepID=A0A7I8JJF0_SPIIN|nr:unnamed protein product [Spirodela intermedia]CAA6670259.1 unnamed protein product [Spirodela intermedia]